MKDEMKIKERGEEMFPLTRRYRHGSAFNHSRVHVVK